MNKNESTYNDLGYEEKRVLQLKSFSSNGLSRTNLVALMNASDLKKFKGKAYKITDLDTLVESLQNKRLLNKNLECMPSISHYVISDAFSGKYKDENLELLKNGKASHCLNRIRIAVYLNDAKQFERYIINRYQDKKINFYLQQAESIELIAKEIAMIVALDQAWLEKLAKEIQIYIVATKLVKFIRGENLKKEEIAMISLLIDRKFHQWNIRQSYLVEIFTTFFILTGKLNLLSILRESLGKVDILQYYQLYGIEQFLLGKDKEAIESFESARAIIKREYKRRNNSLSSIYGIFHIMSLLNTSDMKLLQEIAALISFEQKSRAAYNKAVKDLRYSRKLSKILYCYYPNHEVLYSYFALLVDFLETGDKNNWEFSDLVSYNFSKNIFTQIILCLGFKWADNLKYPQKNNLISFIKKYPDILLGARAILSNLYSTETLDVYKVNFIEIVKTKPVWERSLDSLNYLLNQQTSQVTQESKQLIWLLYINKYGDVDKIEVRERKIGGNNVGRVVSLERLQEEWKKIPSVGQHDIKIINTIKRRHNYYGYEYYVDQEEALEALIGHPAVYNEKTGNLIELVEGKPELIVEEKDNNYCIKLSDNSRTPTVKLIKESVNRYRVVRISEKIAQIASRIKSSITVPKEHKEKVLSLVQKAVPNIKVRSELSDESLETEQANSNLIAQLSPINEGLNVNLIVRPFKDGIAYHPMKGAKSIISLIGDKHKKLVRDFAQEQKNVESLVSQCSTLDISNGDSEWTINDLETSLEVLYEIEKYQKENKGDHIEIEWPKGNALSIKKSVGFKDIVMNLRGENDWFEFSGKVKLEEDKVVEMEQFLEMLEHSQGRFIKLDNNKFIALTESLLKRAQELKVIAHNGKVHKLGSSILSEFIEKSPQVKTDHLWKEHLKKISPPKVEPKIPRTLQAELRDYQVEGFRWLSRLANMSLGGCLADDMGLGKTLQTISLLLNEASSGPCLVIAPASVCNVWEEECGKFAPSLNCVRMPDVGREECIKSLKKMDLLIVSYGMLYQIEDSLIDKKWHLIVLDEAQAIKNYNTKRFKIIIKLKSNKRIALSGTPIENRTEELWNLFEFLNPGFLGSRQNFQSKYVKAIDIDKNVMVRNALKRLIKPFILRRLKSKVLKELPAKTEQTILIDPSVDEKNFYEALRRESVERIHNIGEEEVAKKRFSILSEITKLRRACCDSSLVNSDANITNSKLEALDGILDDILSNNHRTLIFSQYVDYLKIVEKRFIKNNIKYQYLDGSTTQKQRKKRVENFQRGEGDVFLISLKAGGVGLNLTSADYVVHLDPWWNPAIEDQASDRVHRIGQTRPVVIYRLAMKHSIEEKILNMHKNKRDLAIGLLSDSDKSASLTEKELLDLLMDK